MLSLFMNWCASTCSKNAAAWVFAGLFIFSLFSHYDTERELGDVCDRILTFRDKPVDPQARTHSLVQGIHRRTVTEVGDPSTGSGRPVAPSAAKTAAERGHIVFTHKYDDLVNTCHTRLIEPYED